MQLCQTGASNRYRAGVHPGNRTAAAAAGVLPGAATPAVRRGGRGPRPDEGARGRGRAALRRRRDGARRGRERRTCMIMPEVMMGEMPNSINVPRDDARIMRMM